MRYKERLHPSCTAPTSISFRFLFVLYSALQSVANAMPGHFHTGSVNAAGENSLYLSFSNYRGILIAQLVHCSSSQPIAPFYIGRCGPFPNSKDSLQEMAPYRAQ